MSDWLVRFKTLGWAACHVVPDSSYICCGDEDIEMALRSSSTLAIGVPHPRYGIMRGQVWLTTATSLTRLAAIATSTSVEVPCVFVGSRMFRDHVDGAERGVLGLIAFRGVNGDVQVSPLAAVRWLSLWLPYFEDVNDWVMTGWDVVGRVSESFKPPGWRSEEFYTSAAQKSSVVSTGESRRSISSV